MKMPSFRSMIIGHHIGCVRIAGVGREGCRWGLVPDNSTGGEGHQGPATQLFDMLFVSRAWVCE